MIYNDESGSSLEIAFDAPELANGTRTSKVMIAVRKAKFSTASSAWADEHEVRRFARELEGVTDRLRDRATFNPSREIGLLVEGVDPRGYCRCVVEVRDLASGDSSRLVLMLDMATLDRLARNVLSAFVEAKEGS